VAPPRVPRSASIAGFTLDGRTVPIAELCEVQDAEAVRAWVVFYRSNLMAADLEPISALMVALDREGLAPLARRRKQFEGSGRRGPISRV
jgi:hypothetical protein